MSIHLAAEPRARYAARLTWNGSSQMTPLDEDAVQLELLAMRHCHRLEQFERANREFFASRISDRGDDYFTHFADVLAERVAENESGNSLFFVLVATAGRIVGRVNISDIDQPGLTELGFRVDQGMQGKGVATRGVMKALEIARERGVTSVVARVALDNPGSQRVLEWCGFTVTGSVDAPPGSDRTFTGYRILL